MEAVLCSKKRTDDYLWVINEVHVQTLRSYISTDINCLGVFLSSFWAVWRGLLWCPKAKLISWQFPRYWQFNRWYHGCYQLICLISWPILIALRCDWYQLKGLFKGFKLALRPWESSKNWWRYDWMKFVTGRWCSKVESSSSVRKLNSKPE